MSSRPPEVSGTVDEHNLKVYFKEDPSSSPNVVGGGSLQSFMQSAASCPDNSPCARLRSSASPFLATRRSESFRAEFRSNPRPAGRARTKSRPARHCSSPCSQNRPRRVSCGSIVREAWVAPQVQIRFPVFSTLPFFSTLLTIFLLERSLKGRAIIGIGFNTAPVEIGPWVRNWDDSTLAHHSAASYTSSNVWQHVPAHLIQPDLISDT